MRGGQANSRTGLVISISLGVMVGAAAWRWAGVWTIVLGGVFFAVAWRRGAGMLIAICLMIGIGIGWARASQLGQGVSSARQYFGQKVTIIGRIQDDPAYADNGQLEAYVGDVEIVPSRAGSVANILLPGRLRLRGYSLSLVRGDRLQATGTLRDGFGSYTASMYYAQITVLQHSSDWAGYMRRKFQAGLYNALPDPQASIAFGLLVGARSGLPKSLNNQLAAVGLMHLVAVSGYNLTILVRASRKLSSMLSPIAGFLLASTLIVGFLLVTGFSASIVRAAIVSGLSLLAAYYGREVNPMVLLTLSAAITVLLNPMYIWGDLGWYLSFLAFFGILGLAPVLLARYKTERLWRQILIETMSAIVMTTPLIMYSFGRVSAIAPLSNVVVLPTIPFAMLFSFLGGVAGMLKPEISWFFAWPAKRILGLVVAFIERLSAVSWAQFKLSMSALGMVMSYGLLFVIFLILKNKNPTKHGIITDRNNHNAK